MSLYQKHRPKKFEQIVGNSGVVESLTGIVGREFEDRPHAFLFTGSSGTGKTTLGRILAKELGCKGQDFYEIDSADFRGIDSIRDMRRRMSYAPAESKCRVWLLDECHKITNDAQNALLKALEDTPMHVYLILCTTNPEKLLKTIKTRCTTFETQPIGARLMQKYLTKVVKKEKSKVPDDALKQICKDANGSMRQGLVVLDKIIDLDPENMQKAAEQAADLESTTIVLCRALLNDKSSWKVVAGMLTGLKEQEPERIRHAVLGYATAVLSGGKQNGRARLMIECFGDNYYDNNRAGLVASCYDVITGWE